MDRIIYRVCFRPYMWGLRRALKLTAFKIATWYLVLGIFWIIISDRLVFIIADSSSKIVLLQTIKGWIFVLLSAIFFFVLTRIREQQLEEARDRAQSATQQLQVLNRVFRHNIRNNLNVIKGYTDLVRESTDDYEARKMLGMASRRATTLVETSEKFHIVTNFDIDDNLNTSIDVARMTLEEVNRFQDRYPAVTVHVDLPDNLVVIGGDSLRYAIREVLINAAEHYPGPQDECEVTVTADISTSSATVRFEDNGAGIPSEEMDVLTSGESSQLVHSSGVGLWLVTWICDYFQGDVRFSNPEDGGAVVETTFQLENPLATIIHRRRKTFE